MRYVIGVDGGQTRTTAVLADEQGRLLGVGHGGPANHVHEAGGVERIRRSLSEAIAEAMRSAGRADVPLACAYLGMTGSSPQMEAICRPVVPAGRMVLGHDSRIALYAVTFGRPGVVVIGGTGSVAYGRNAQGEEALVGGWGYLIGDEGSGYWIALRALNACTRAADGRGPRTRLTAHLQSRLNAASLREIHRQLYSGALSRPDIAALSVCVSEAADRGDRVAQRILRAAGRELGLQAVRVLRLLRMTSGEATVGMVGGVFQAGAWVQGPFEEIVRRAVSGARVLPARIPAAVAAVLLALEEIGVSIGEVALQNVYATLPSPDRLKPGLLLEQEGA